MLGWLISHDAPPRPWSRILVAAVVLGLLVVPLTDPSVRSLNVAAKVIVFATLAASFILLLGYTGIVSFAHTVFFGIGGYAVAQGLLISGATVWGGVAGLAAGLCLSVLVALLIAALSLRVRAIYFSMVTLVAALVVSQLASRTTGLTGGQDGLLFDVPEVFYPAYVLWSDSAAGFQITGRTLLYYVLFFVSALSFLLMLRIVNSPFGRVLQAIRENEFRARSLGYPTTVYKAVSSMLSAAFATVAGALYTLWLGYVGPGSTLSLNVLTEILLIIVIGGSGSLYGAIVGSLLIVLSENYLQPVLSALIPTFVAQGPAGMFLSGERWLLWLGLLYVVAIYVAPDGIVGMARRRPRRHRLASHPAPRD